MDHRVKRSNITIISPPPAQAREPSRPVSDVPVVSGQANTRKTSLPPMSLVTPVRHVSQQQPIVTPVTTVTPVASVPLPTAPILLVTASVPPVLYTF